MPEFIVGGTVEQGSGGSVYTFEGYAKPLGGVGEEAAILREHTRAATLVYVGRDRFEREFSHA